MPWLIMPVAVYLPMLRQCFYFAAITGVVLCIKPNTRIITGVLWRTRGETLILLQLLPMLVFHRMEPYFTLQAKGKEALVAKIYGAALNSLMVNGALL